MPSVDDRTATNDEIFLYEDDDALVAEIVDAFRQECKVVSRLADDRSLLAMLRRGCGAVLILDRMVRGLDSLNVLARERADGNVTPVVVISSLVTVDDRICGLKAGGDDYLVKPFAMGELVARVEALRRRSRPQPRTALVVGPLTMDLIARTVSRDGKAITLVAREYALLEYLMHRAGTVVTRTMLLEDVWRYRLTTHTNVVDVHVGNLRRKIEVEGAPRLIASVRGLGFVLSAADEPEAAAALSRT